MAIDVERTRKYYEEELQFTTYDNYCPCNTCQTYIRGVREEYPELAEYLWDLGIAIERPYELMLGRKVGRPGINGYIEDILAQYVVLGESKKFGERMVGSIDIRVTDSYPDPYPGAIEEPYFMIELYPIHLKWRCDFSRIRRKKEKRGKKAMRPAKRK